MKRFFFLIFIVLLFSVSAFATAPKLETKEPSFAGFTGSFMKFGKVSSGNRSFTMSVSFGQWFFDVSGLANAGHNTDDLDILLEDITAVLAYYDAKGQTSSGESYQAGLFDLMVYLDDEPIKVSNLKFSLTGKATEGSKVLEQAKTWNFVQGSIFKNSKYSSNIMKAQAASVDKSDIAKEEAAAKKKVADSIAREKKRVADSIARVEKKAADSIAKIEKRKKDSIAAEKKKAAAAKRRAMEEDDDEDEPPVKKKRKKAADDDEPAKKKKKRKPAVEEDDDEPPVKKKKKKRD
ncbi:MAG: hypothetical protein LBH25_09975 [Fibromonadaceae bacterium]|nr:hypothetical protein [Fibromonadaceae bacterium]